MSQRTLKSLFAHKTWADAELLAALAGVSATAHPAELQAALRTMNHIHVVDQIFRGHLLGEPHGHGATNTAETPTLAALRDRVARTDAWFEQHVAGLGVAALDEIVDFSFTDGDAGRTSREEILLHVVTHGGYHRGAVGQILKSVSMVPPRDLLTRFLHQAEPARRERA